MVHGAWFCTKVGEKDKVLFLWTTYTIDKKPYFFSAPKP